jgi:hypothetical protein
LRAFEAAARHLSFKEAGIPPDEMKVDRAGVEAFRHRLSGNVVCPHRWACLTPPIFRSVQFNDPLEMARFGFGW